MKPELKTHLIKELLNTSTLQLPPATLEKLRSARSRALEHQRTRRSVAVFAWQGHHEGGNDSFHMSKPMAWAIAVLFAAFLASAASFWQNYDAEHDISEVDIAILTDDLPIHVYVD